MRFAFYPKPFIFRKMQLKSIQLHPRHLPDSLNKPVPCIEFSSDINMQASLCNIWIIHYCSVINSIVAYYKVHKRVSGIQNSIFTVCTDYCLVGYIDFIAFGAIRLTNLCQVYNNISCLCFRSCSENNRHSLFAWQLFVGKFRNKKIYYFFKSCIICRHAVCYYQHPRRLIKHPFSIHAAGIFLNRWKCFFIQAWFPIEFYSSSIFNIFIPIKFNFT